MRILGFAAQGGGVAALAADEGSPRLRAVPLQGTFEWRVRPVRTCVGTVDGAAHVPCPTGEPVSVHRQCLPCSGLEDAECVFEPRCQGDPAACTCVSSFKGVPHVVYLAFHGVLPKVGMTSERRLPWRLREQGADAYLVVARLPDRATARATERQVAYLHGIPEHRGHRETLPQLARAVPWEGIEARAAQLRQRLGAHHPVEPALHRIADHPLPQPLPGRPRRVPSEGLHRGTWVGCKGNHLVYREAPRPDRLDAGSPPLAALKLSDLVGRAVDVLAAQQTAGRAGTAETERGSARSAVPLVAAGEPR